MHFNTELDVSYASLFLKVIVTMFENYILLEPQGAHNLAE